MEQEKGTPSIRHALSVCEPAAAAGVEFPATRGAASALIDRLRREQAGTQRAEREGVAV